MGKGVCFKKKCVLNYDKTFCAKKLKNYFEEKEV